MNILHFIYDHINNPWVGGGGAVRVYAIYKRLAERHQVTVVCGRYPGGADYQEGNLTVRFVGTSWNSYALSTFCYATEATRFLYKHRQDADIVIEDFAPYNPIFSRFIADSPAVIQTHHKEGINLFRRYSLLGIPFMFIESTYPRLFHTAICVSEESMKKFNLMAATIIPNGIDDKLLRLSAPERSGYIAYIGRLNIHNKGLDTAIKAMERIKTRLVIAGKGRDKPALDSLIRKSGLKGQVELAGYLDETKKTEFLVNSQFVVVPSRYEGQGIVVLETAACGKPVIVSDIPELKYAVDAGFGLSFRTGDEKDLAAKIGYLLENEPLRKEMGLKGREYARNFTWDKIAEKYEIFLIKLLRSS